MFPFGISLSLRTKIKDRLELCIPLRSRLLFAFFFVLSCFVFLSSILSEDKPGGHAIPLVLVGITGLGTLYDERWIFDKNRNRVESRFGLLILSRKKYFPLVELARVELDSFIKGRGDVSTGSHEDTPPSSLFKTPQRRHMDRIIRLRVVDKQGGAHVLDSTKAHRIEEFRLIGRRIADFCGIPFREN